MGEYLQVPKVSEGTCSCLLGWRVPGLARRQAIELRLAFAQVMLQMRMRLGRFARQLGHAAAETVARKDYLVVLAVAEYLEHLLKVAHDFGSVLLETLVTVSFPRRAARTHPDGIRQFADTGLRISLDLGAAFVLLVVNADVQISRVLTRVVLGPMTV